MTSPATSAVQTPAIRVEGLWRFFGKQTAVKNLTLEIPMGTVFGLIGPNGAGKSTLIRMLMGMLPPSHGHVCVLGKDVFASPVMVRQRVGYVPETHHIYRWMRVVEVIGLCRAAYVNWNDATCGEMLQLFGLDPHKKVKHLSKGMQVKLALLIAVSHEPELLVLDEPMAGLDPIARDEFLDGVLRTVCARHSSVLFSTHTLADVQRLADTVGILNEGQLLVHSNIDQLLTTTKRIRATLKNDKAPEALPPGTVWQRTNGREWLVTVSDFNDETLNGLRADENLEHVEVIDLGLEDLFKDYIKGQRAAS